VIGKAKPLYRRLAAAHSCHRGREQARAQLAERADSLFHFFFDPVRHFI